MRAGAFEGVVRGAEVVCEAVDGGAGTVWLRGVSSIQTVERLELTSTMSIINGLMSGLDSF